MAKQGNFKAGDIVKLKSGGPEMAVEKLSLYEGEHYRCQWFAGKKLESGTFPVESLELVKQQAK